MSDVLVIIAGCLTVLVLLIALRIEQRMGRLERRIEELLAPPAEQEQSGAPTEHAAGERQAAQTDE